MDHLLAAVVTLANHRTHSAAAATHLHHVRSALAKTQAHKVLKAHKAHKAHKEFRFLGIHLRFHPHLRPRGPALDYIALFFFAMLSGFGINGFGEVALLGAGIYVANHKLPIEPVILIAFLGAMIGGILGWLVGWQVGRRLLTAPGPLHRLRTRMLEHSEAVYFMHPAFAVVLTPSWAAGIEKVHWRQYAPLNALSALIWALPLGLGAFFLGRRVTTDFSDEIGWVVAAVVVVFVLYALLQRFLGRPRQTAR